MEKIIYELEEIESIKRKIKRQSMIYQYDLKIEVANILHLSFEQVNLPFLEWSHLRDMILEK